MADDFPLSNLHPDLEECDAILRDMLTTVSDLLTDTEGQYPPGGAEFCRKVVAARAILGGLIPDALRQAIADDKAALDEIADRYEPPGY